MITTYCTTKPYIYIILYRFSSINSIRNEKYECKNTNVEYGISWIVKHVVRPPTNICPEWTTTTYKNHRIVRG